MATGVELGTAYLSLVASTSGLAGSVRKGLGGAEKEADASGKRAGKKFSGGVGGAIKSGAARLVAPIGAALATVGVSKFFSDAVASASDFQEAGTKIEAIFGKGGSAVQDYAKNAAKDIGQSTNAALDAAGTFGVFGKSAGLSGKDLAKFSTDFVGLSTDLASFNNTTPEQAVEAIGAALRGESEPMRQYGVLLDDATLRNRALKLGLIETTKQALTPQQKVLAAQAEIYAQTKDAQGDFAKTSGGLANQQRILKAQFEDVKTQVGQFLLPIMNKLALVFTEKVMPAIRDFIQGWKDGSGAGGTFRDILERVGSALKSVGSFLAEHRTAVVAVIGAYAGFKVVAATMRAYRAVVLAVRAAQAGYAAASYGAAAATYAQGKAGKAGLIVGKLFNGVVRAGSAVQRGFAAAALGTRIQLAALAAQEKVSAAIARLSLGTRLQLAALWVREKAAMVAHRVALIASTVATKAATLATKALNLVMRANPIGLIITAVTALVGALVWFFTKTKLGKKIIEVAWKGIKTAIKAVADWWTKTAWPAIKRVIDKFALGFKVAGWVIGEVWKKIKNAIKTVAAWIGTRINQLVTFFKGVPGRLKAAFGRGWDFLKETASKAIGSYSSGGGGVKGLLWNIVNFVKNTLPNKIKAAAKNIWSGLVGNALDVVGGVMKLVGKIPGVNGEITLSAAGVTKSYKYAQGGVLPGYTPGRDVHHFTSPTGGRLSLSGGEAIMRPEFTRMVGGAAGVARLNAMARKGQAFADGGIWTMEKFKTPEGLPGPVAWLVKNTLGRLTVPSLLNATVKRILGFFNIGAGSDGGSVKAGSGGRAGMGIAAMTRALHSLMPGTLVTSGYRPGARTVTGYPSYHGLGRAIDIVPGSSGLSMGQIWDRLMAAYGKSAPEIFYSGRNFSRFGRLGNKRGDHWDHVHWAMKSGGVLPKLYDQGGWLPRGLSVVENRTSKPERILNEDQWNAMAGGERTVENHFHGITDAKLIVAEIRREERNRAIRLGMAGR